MQNQRKDYITTETRRLLVELVLEEGKSISEAAKMLKVNYSTSKNLLRKFKQTGNVDRVRGPSVVTN